MRLTVWDLPGPRRWLDRALANVADGRPLIVVSPDPDRPTNLGGHLTTELEERLGCDVEVVDPFPMTVTGKVRKVEMREAAERMLGLSRPASHP